MKKRAMLIMTAGLMVSGYTELSVAASTGCYGKSKTECQSSSTSCSWYISESAAHFGHPGFCISG